MWRHSSATSGPGTTETYTAFHPDFLKDAAKALDKLVRATCAPLPRRHKPGGFSFPPDDDEEFRGGGGNA
jgi:hypothetical protein